MADSCAGLGFSNVYGNMYTVRKNFVPENSFIARSANTLAGEASIVSVRETSAICEIVFCPKFSRNDCFRCSLAF